MTRFFTSDLHLGHANIIRYSARPFADVDEMDVALVDRWNETVGDEDDVWVLGDVAMGTLRDSLPLIELLRGRKVLVPGNHDRCWDGNSKGVERWTQEYLDAGFDEIRQGPVRLEVAGSDGRARSVLLAHFPYRGDSQDEDRFVDQRPPDDGHTLLLHGHVHESWKVNGRMANVGVDVWDYRPVAESTLVDALLGLTR